MKAEYLVNRTLPEQQWQDVLGHLKAQYPLLTRAWFDHLFPGDLTNGTLTIVAKNPAQLSYLDGLCKTPFTEAAQAATGRLLTICFRLDPLLGDATPGRATETSSLGLNPLFTFDRFVIGPGNRLAHAASMAVAASPGQTYNPLFLHGAVGLGKTHLMHAACQESLKVRCGLSVLVLSCEEFTHDFMESVTGGDLYRFRHRYRDVDLLAIDDVQFLAERERSQEEFFHLFNALHQNGKQILLSADCSPAEIPSLEQRLVSRFNSGLVACIDPPCFETRLAILRQKAKARCFEIGEDTLRWIAFNITENPRELEGMLTRLDALSQVRGVSIDVRLAEEALGGQVDARISLPRIIDLVTEYYGVKPSDLAGKKRQRRVTVPRQVCMYLARKYTDHSLEEIGACFGGRDHSTVLHAVRHIDGLRSQLAAIRKALAEIELRIGVRNTTDSIVKS